MRIQAVVIPVYEEEEANYLSTLTKRSSKPTTLIYGWQRSRSRSRMVTPQRLLEQQSYVPFLFTPADQEPPKSVTHVAISGLIIHRGSAVYRRNEHWLARHRVERFCNDPEDRPSAAVGTFYVVTDTRRLTGEREIPFQKLTLVSQTRRLSPRKKRGYSIVWLPSHLSGWYAGTKKKWEALHGIPS